MKPYLGQMSRKERRTEDKPPLPQGALPRVQEVFADALRHHQAGRLNEAERLYRQLLQIDSRHAHALHLLGVLAHQGGRNDIAGDLIAKAIALNSQVPSFHSNLGLVLHTQGKLEEAVASYRQALAHKPDFPNAHYNLGNALRDQGNIEEAVASYRRALAHKPDFAEAHYNLGIWLQDQGKLEQAVVSYERALAHKPDYAEAHNNLGNALKDQGKLEDAVTSFGRALAHKPDYAEAHYNLGNTLRVQGKLEDAVVSYERSLAHKPDFAEAHNNLGNALVVQGKLEEALVSYERALAYKPNFAEAHYNLGNTLQCIGKLDEAVICYDRALEIKFDYVDVLNNYALLLNAQGRSVRALRTIEQSLRIKETREAKNIFIFCIKHLRFMERDSEIRIALVRALREPWGRPIDLAPVSSEFVKLNPDIGMCVARATNAWPLQLAAEVLFGANGLTALAADTLLLALLTSAPVCDVEMERFLTMARRAMLETAVLVTALDAEVGSALNFYSALAQQCFINEYVFSLTDGEIQRAIDLRDSLISALESGAKVPNLWTVAVAAYFPLGSLPLAGRLLDSRGPDPLMAVLEQQILEPNEEQKLCDTIPRLTAIEDGVSVSVQKQYEENPYPRWVRTTAAPEGKDIVGYLCQKFPLSSFERQGKSGCIDVLVAGCGTGQHSIEVAQKFQRTKVLAVDLSMNSLGYAKRKTQKLGLASIDYAQADLLKLGSLGRRFDVIEAVGVLHHLADPFEGWRVLLALLLPGGFMKVGLYSEVAQRSIARASAVIAERGYIAATANEIRECRQYLTGIDKQGSFETITKSLDFFSTSSCRDLLFHAKEHCLTLSSIEEFCQENNLTFLGFEIDAAVLHAYRGRFPDDRAGTNLQQWQIFENETPLAFSRMYVFWIQKDRWAVHLDVQPSGVHPGAILGH
jgi:tetratricopeptide (TPR) repeat protein/2-polyprenyl-3-methyl-5-hydroxy-6-metoxy-1,4-benzoquinol methylase